MIAIRLLRFQKQYYSIVLWLILPFVLTLLLSTVPNKTIPIGIVDEDNSDLSQRFIETLQQQKAFTVIETNYATALQQLESHQLDSVFVIEENFKTLVTTQQKARLLTSISSNLSLFHESTSNIVLTTALQLVGQYATIDVIKSMQPDTAIDSNALIAKSTAYMKEKSILTTSLHMTNQTAAHTTSSSFLIWSLFATLSTLLASTWLIKEHNTALLLRAPFSNHTVTSYFLYHLTMYTVLFFVMDCLALYQFANISWANITILFAFRLTISCLSACLALCCHSIIRFYQYSLLLMTLLLFTSGLWVPMPYQLQLLQPQIALLQQSITIWLPISLLSLVLLLKRKERRYVNH